MRDCDSENAVTRSSVLYFEMHMDVPTSDILILCNIKHYFLIFFE